METIVVLRWYTSFFASAPVSGYNCKWKQQSAQKTLAFNVHILLMLCADDWLILKMPQSLEHENWIGVADDRNVIGD